MDARGTPPPQGQPPPSPAYRPQPQGPASQPPPSPAYGAQAPTSGRPPEHTSAPPPPAVGRTPDGRTTLVRVLRAWWSGRLRRLVPRGVPWTAVAFAVVLLAAWALFADILLTPGVVMPFPGETPSRDWAHDVIGWVALQVTFGLGFASATMLLQLLRPWHRWASVGVALASTAVTLGMVTSGPGQALPWIAGVATTGLVAAACAVLAALLPSPRVHLAVAAALALVLQWGLVTWVGAIEPTQWVFLSAWTNLAFPVLLVIGGVAILAVAAYAQQVHARADRIGRRILLASWVPVAAAATMLVVVLLRMGPLSTLFGEVDANVWGFGPLTAWPHAVLSGGLVVWLVARTGRRPLRARGHVLVVVVLALMAGMAYVSFLLVYVALTFTDATIEQAEGLTSLLLANGNGAGLVVAALLLVPVLVPWFRRSTGRVGALVAIVVAVPMQLWLILSIDLDLPWPRFAATPSQSALVVLVVVLALAIWGAARGRDVVDRHLLLRLALIPVLTMHAGQLLPGVWKDDLEQALVVVLSLAGLVLLGAPRTGTKEGDARAIVVPFAMQMAVLGSVIVARTMGQYMDDESTTISVLYLTLPVATVLCCRLEDASDAWMRGASTVDLQTLRRTPTQAPVVAPVGAWGDAGRPPQPQPQPQPQPHGPWASPQPQGGPSQPPQQHPQQPPPWR